MTHTLTHEAAVKKVFFGSDGEGRGKPNSVDQKSTPHTNPTKLTHILWRESRFLRPVQQQQPLGQLQVSVCLYVSALLYQFSPLFDLSVPPQLHASGYFHLLTSPLS